MVSRCLILGRNFFVLQIQTQRDFRWTMSRVAGKLAMVVLKNYSQIHTENHAYPMLAIKPHEARVKLQDSVTKILN